MNPQNQDPLNQPIPQNPDPQQPAIAQNPYQAPTPTPVQQPSSQQSTQPNPYQPTPQQPTQPVGSFGPSVPPPNIPSANKKSKKRLFAGLAVLVMLIASGAGYFILGKNKDDSSASSSTSSSLSTDTSSSALDPNKEKTPETTKVPLSQVITADLGYTITLNELVRNYPVKYPDSNKETVLVKSTITYVNPKYTGSSPYPSDFSLVVGGKSYDSSGSVYSNDLTKAGYAPMPLQPTKQGAPVSGYIAIDIPKNSTEIIFRYEQKQTKILGGGTIPAKNYDVKIN